MAALRQQLVSFVVHDQGIKEVMKHKPEDLCATLYQYDNNAATFKPTAESLLFNYAIDYYRQYGATLPPQAVSSLKVPDNLKPEVQVASSLIYSMPVDLPDLARITTELKKRWVATRQVDIYNRTQPQDASNPGRNLAEAISELTTLQSVLRVDDGLAIKSVKDMADEAVAELIDKRDNPDKYIGLPTGFPTFDEKTGGLYPGELLIFGGRPGIGKSSLMMRILFTMYLTDKKVLLVNREMSVKLQHRRFSTLYLCMDDVASMMLWGGNVQRLLKTGIGLTDEQLGAYTAFHQSLKDLPGEFYMTDPMGVRTLDELDILIEHALNHTTLDAIGIDSGNIQELGGGREAWTRDDQQKLIAEKMVELSIKYESVLICDLQTNRDKGTEEDSGLESFALSDWWGRAAHHAWKIWPSMEDKTAKIQIVKCRDDESGWEIPVLYDLGRMLIVEQSTQQVI